MNNKQRALEFIKCNPGHTAQSIAIALGAKKSSSMELDELEKEGLIRWDMTKYGWVPTGKEISNDKR